MIICLCDKKNAGAFKKYFQVVEVKDLSAKERRECLDMIVDTRARVYGLMSATISDEAYSIMDNCSIDQAEKVLDTAIRLNSANHKDITITADMIAPHVKNTHKSTIGFGGDTNYVK